MKSHKRIPLVERILMHYSRKWGQKIDRKLNQKGKSK